MFYNFISDTTGAAFLTEQILSDTAFFSHNHAEEHGSFITENFFS